MHILVFNSGSSSLKFRCYGANTTEELRLTIRGSVTHLGSNAQWLLQIGETQSRGQHTLLSHYDAARWVLKQLGLQRITFEAIGHRIVHGGSQYRDPTPLTPDVLDVLHEVTALAPLHNPPALDVIRACRERMEHVSMIGVFDTAFHADLPPAAREYALPSAWTQPLAIRRYGFHGIAHQYMVERYLDLSGQAQSGSRIVTLQLGNGCSVCAARDGRSIETSMGFTPLEGLVMATRGGDIDPGALAQIQKGGVSLQALERGLNEESGLLALSGVSGDMQTLLNLENQGHAGARLAIEAFCHRARKYLGAYLAVLGGADAVIFGGGIGEHAPAIRARICADMDWCGLRLDAAANAAAIGAEKRISVTNATVEAYVITVEEERLIAEAARALVTGPG